MSMVTLGKKYSSNKITKKSLHKIYQKLLHVIVKVVTSIFRSLPNLTKVKFDQVFKLYSLFLLKIGSTTVFTVPFWTIHIWTLPIWTVVVWMVIFLAFLTENYGNWYLGSLYIETIGFRRLADKNGFFHFEKHPTERLGPLRLWQCLHNPGSDTI